MDQINAWLSDVAGVVWGWPLLILLLGTHLFLTVRLGFIQRYMGRAIRISLRRSSEGAGDISQFGALTTALAATIGTGNIIGVAGAIVAGGPGAVLWMWLTGVFGIATKYGEALLSVHYRVQMPNGQMAGGPMYVLERGLKARWLGLVFAALTALAAFGIGNMVQANAIAKTVDMTLALGSDHVLARTFLDIPLLRWLVGAAVTALTALVILGGIRSIARVCQLLVPFMAVFYMGGCLALLAMHWQTIPDTIALICTSAFTGQAAIGGFVGAGLREVIRFGVARGLFSNESGLGSAPIVAAAAQTAHPVRQALVSASGTFWDTVVICAITGIVLVNGGQWMHVTDKELLTSQTFGAFGSIGPIVLNVGLLTFVFSTILGWSYYGEKAVEYIFGTRAVRWYRYLWVAAVLVGATVQAEAVWNFADVANGCMVVPNVISLVLLSGVAARVTREYFAQHPGRM
ncbi:MAG: Amino-acid carrier protein AlsT [Planctomycetes bacterium ADurb.Bin126]|nr:MAG: Amino-acid carrier protein AlsT [Planctomycetes bacterium ADurb.Bin126]HOD82218.1 sodium:alanine symporter family protein [Phycisphaerae bacterium]HQL74654.1 sodium:alanine symporter family protein [Phycisphaerae bacterium]